VGEGRDSPAAEENAIFRPYPTVTTCPRNVYAPAFGLSGDGFFIVMFMSGGFDDE